MDDQERGAGLRAQDMGRQGPHRVGLLDSGATGPLFHSKSPRLRAPCPEGWNCVERSSMVCASAGTVRETVELWASAAQCGMWAHGGHGS